MAENIGMPRRFYQGPPKTRYPHYDIPLEMRAEAIDWGAIEITQREAPAIAKRSLAASKSGTSAAPETLNAPPEDESPNSL